MPSSTYDIQMMICAFQRPNNSLRLGFNKKDVYHTYFFLIDEEKHWTLKNPKLCITHETGTAELGTHRSDTSSTKHSNEIHLLQSCHKCQVLKGKSALNYTGLAVLLTELLKPFSLHVAIQATSQSVTSS